MGQPDPSETPREATDALALADLASRAGMLNDIAKLDRTWTLLAGKREDVALGNLAALKIAVDDPHAFEKLKTAIGNGYPRTARFHPMPEGATDLPVIATFLGPRITPEAAPLRMLTNSEVPDRHMLVAADVAYVLGVDRAKQYTDTAKFPTLGAQLDRAREALNHQADSGDLYGAWLHALGAKQPDGVLPTFMRSDAYQDLRVDSAVAGYGQIRHNYVALAAQGYDEGGCDIPDGYVEPRVGTYEAIADYARRGAAMMAEVDPSDKTMTKSYFSNLETIAKVLATISRHELEGRDLTGDEQNFLGMVVEMVPGSTGSLPTYTGWYFDLFRNRWIEALSDSAFIADYYTSGSEQKVAYAGGTFPQMGIFVIDTGGQPRLAVGPVARGFSTTGPLDKRYTSLDDVTKFDDPWAKSYSAPTVPAVPFGLRAELKDDNTIAVVMTAPKAIPDFTIHVLNHHGEIINTLTSNSAAAKKTTRIKVWQPKQTTPEGLRIVIGDYHVESFVGDIGRTIWMKSGGVDPPTDE